ASAEASKGNTSTSRGLTAASPGTASARAMASTDTTSDTSLTRRWPSRMPIVLLVSSLDVAFVLPSPPSQARQPRECRRPHAAERDVRHQQHRDQPDEPGPDLDRDPRLAAQLQERLAGIVERSAAGQLRHLAEPRFVHAEV